MTYDLYIGDRTFSSWSLRGWLMMQHAGEAFRTHLVGLYAGTLAVDLAHIAPARTVPALRTPEGHVLTDSIAMAETLVERHPDLPLYPSDPDARALCRSIIAEMHGGFSALRGDCPMQLLCVWDGFQPSDAVRSDLARIELLWSLARERHGAAGPWLFGSYSFADAFYAPVAMRIAGYDLPVNAAARAYVDAHLSEQSFLAWRTAALTETYDPVPYTLDLPQKPWPVGIDQINHS